MKVVKPAFEIKTLADWSTMLRMLEEVGRKCYKSEDKITEDSYEGFLRGIIDRGHEAIIEHVSFTVFVICDRGVSHEIVRHRIASYAQESTRFCNYSKDKFDNSVSFIDLHGGMEFDTKMQTLTPDKVWEIYDEWQRACCEAEAHYLRMLELGATPQIARSVLPNSTKTEIAITMNLREWRHFFKLRTALAAHPQMREIMLPLLAEIQTQCPLVFGDIGWD
jgi:thymidylate synthase (FAD)